MYKFHPQHTDQTFDNFAWLTKLIYIYNFVSQIVQQTLNKINIDILVLRGTLLYSKSHITAPNRALLWSNDRMTAYYESYGFET